VATKEVSQLPTSLNFAGKILIHFFLSPVWRRLVLNGPTDGEQQMGSWSRLLHPQQLELTAQLKARPWCLTLHTNVPGF
jgi:hypothetical protein